MRRRTRVRAGAVCKVGTIAHNRAFTRNDFAEYVGAPRMLDALVRRKLIKRVERGQYYPTATGWKVIEKSCRLDAAKRR